MDRRDFVQRLPALSTGLLLGASSLSLSACAGVQYVVPRGTARRLVIGVDELPASGVLIQRPDMEWPVFLRRDESGSYVALLARCTHLGCQPDPIGDRFVCPCHGSEYDLEGAVLQGPAERPLIRYAVVAEGRDLVISIGGSG